MQLVCAGSTRMALAAALALAGLAPHAARAQTALPLVPESAEAPEPSPASVPVPPASIPPVTIRISVASASESEGDLDPAARDIYEHLPAKFQSIRMIEERTLEVQFGEVARVALPSGSEVRLIPVAVHGGQLHLQLEMPELINTSMRMSNSRAFYVGGVPYEGGTLVFKLVPDFTAYVEGPAPQRATPPETLKARGGR